MRKSNRTALVTGGGSGLGKAICLRLAREGMAVGVLGRESNTVEVVAASIVEAGGRAIPLCANIADRSQVEAAASDVRRAFGPIAVLVNNAGVENFCAFGEITDENWDRHIDINLKGTYIVTQVVLPDMVALKWGRIVNVSALGAQVGAPNMVHYTASKGGMIAMTRSLALELGHNGITVNSVSPGFIDTPMARRAIDANLFPVPYEQIIATYPMPRRHRGGQVAEWGRLR